MQLQISCAIRTVIRITSAAHCYIYFWKRTPKQYRNKLQGMGWFLKILIMMGRCNFGWFHPPIQMSCSIRIHSWKRVVVNVYRGLKCAIVVTGAYSMWWKIILILSVLEFYSNVSSHFVHIHGDYWSPLSIWSKIRVTDSGNMNLRDVHQKSKGLSIVVDGWFLLY